MKSLWRLILAALLICCTQAQAQALRVISLYPGHTDNIAALGQAESIAALSQGDDLVLPDMPPRLPATVTPEAVLAHKPDILIMRSFNASANPNLIPVLERAGVRVHVIDPPTWEGFEQYLRRLADVVEADPGPALSRLSDIRESARARAHSRLQSGKKPLVFLEATARELHTCSPDSWAAQVIELCGGRNAAGQAAPLRHGSALAPWGVERAIELSAELDVYLVQQGAMNESRREDVLSRPWFRALAEKKVRLGFVPERTLSRPSLLGLSEGVETLLALFYPQEQAKRR